MRLIVIFLVFASILSGCGALRSLEETLNPAPFEKTPDDESLEVSAELTEVAQPAEAVVDAPIPSGNAQTVEQFDTTTAEQREAAVAPPPVETGEVSLGTTVASLGDPSDPGFWLKTPLVDAEAEGRVVAKDTDKSVQVTLIPIDGPDTAGSRLSLPAMRLLEVPLTDLPELEVFRER